VSAADARAALQIAFGLNPNLDPDGAGPLQPLMVSPYQLMAADVNRSGSVTLSDALAILRMAVQTPNALDPTWMFVEEDRDFWDASTGRFTLDAEAAAWDPVINVDHPAASSTDLVGVLLGDVNGSWQASGAARTITDIDPSHFINLSQSLGSPLDQWGVYPG
jgi:hypothetical protein